MQYIRIIYLVNLTKKETLYKHTIKTIKNTYFTLHELQILSLIIRQLDYSADRDNPAADRDIGVSFKLKQDEGDCSGEGYSFDLIV